MEHCVLAKSMRTLTAITASLKQLSLSNKLVIPEVVVAGMTSSGKSSIIEKLIGFEYLPRQRKTDAQRIQFHFIYAPNLTHPEAQIVEKTSKDIINSNVNFDKLRDHINKVTVQPWGKGWGFANSTISINIYSSFLPNLTIIDLPGYSRISINASHQWMMEKYRDMIMNQIAKPNSIIFGVFAANYDFICCEVFKKMRQCDLQGFRSLAAVTKVDIMDKGTDALSILKNEEIHLRKGYVGIKNRSPDSRLSTSIEQALAEEQKFFKENIIYKDLPAQLWGTQSLSLKLVEVIYEQTMKQLIQITSQLEEKKAAIKLKLEIQQNSGIFQSDHIAQQKDGELKAEFSQLQSLQKLIEEDPLFAKILKNHQQNPQDYNKIPEQVKPVEIIRPKKNENNFDSFFKMLYSPPAPINPPTPPKTTIYANSEQREAAERKKKKTFNKLFGI